MFKEIGSTEAILSGINTLRDGSVKVSFEINPENIKVINSLMSCFLAGEKLFTLGIVLSEIIRSENDG